MNFAVLGALATGSTGSRVDCCRAIETLRGVVIELQMAPIKQEVNIGLEPYLGVVRDSRSLNDCDYLVQSRGALFEHLVVVGRGVESGPAENGRRDRPCSLIAGKRAARQLYPCITTKEGLRHWLFRSGAHR